MKQQLLERAQRDRVEGLEFDSGAVDKLLRASLPPGMVHLTHEMLPGRIPEIPPWSERVGKLVSAQLEHPEEFEREITKVALKTFDDLMHLIQEAGGPVDRMAIFSTYDGGLRARFKDSKTIWTFTVWHDGHIEFGTVDRGSPRAIVVENADAELIARIFASILQQ